MGYERSALNQLLQSPPGTPSGFIDGVVTAAREHMGFDVSFVSKFDGDVKVINHLHGDPGGTELREGLRIPLLESYCYRIACDELPNILPDARGDARVRDLAITSRFNIGAYIGVPVRLHDHRVYGALCCINREPDPSLTERDARFMHVLADIIAKQVDREHAANETHERKVQCIRQVMQDGRLDIVFQPIVDLRQRRTVGYEALSRIDAEPRQGPDRWFADAWEVGYGPELELHAIERALAALPRLPEGTYLSINASPLVLQHAGLLELLAAVAPDRIVLEVTEHAVVERYGPLLEALERLRALGIGIAVDDVGAGYAGLAHVLQVMPGTVKLDMQLNRGIGANPAKQALVAAAVGFAERTGVHLVAEGIETGDEAETLRALGVRYGQGFHFAMPGPLPPDATPPPD